jgi:hypothetical protein
MLLIGAMPRRTIEIHHEKQNKNGAPKHTLRKLVIYSLPNR